MTRLLSALALLSTLLAPAAFAADRCAFANVSFVSPTLTGHESLDEASVQAWVQEQTEAQARDAATLCSACGMQVANLGTSPFAEARQVPPLCHWRGGCQTVTVISVRTDFTCAR